MKKLVLTLTLAMASVAAFAQGKILFQNDTLHLVYFSTTTGGGTGLLASDQAGQAATGSGLSVDLWYGTSASSLSLLKTTTLAGGPFAGVNPSTQASVPLANTQYYFQFQVYSTAAGSYGAALAGQNLYYGESAVFTCTGGSFAATPLTGPASTWAAGTVPVGGSAAGAMGAIPILANVVVPEPTSLALLGLGAAGMMIFRRRK